MPPNNRHIEVLRALWRQLPQGMRSRAQPMVRRVVPDSARRRAPAGNGPSRPLLSIVVPIYNVEEYLDLCLASVARQSVARMEVIIVDDGSMDGSLAIAEGYAAKDGRFTVVRQPNAGLGAARNTGIAHATGLYLGFADSDDVVPDGSYEVMLSALKTSGSDFAVGSVRRLAGERKRQSTWAGVVHSIRRMGTSINEYPAALQDVFAWNKVFDRRFWDTHIGWFPEGLLYEDQEVSTKAFLRATAFDILPEIVYEWRIRSDRSSITQQKSDIKDLRDRVTVIGHMQSLMDAEATSVVKDTWLAKLLGRDLGYYYRQIPRVGDDYWDLLRDVTSTLVAQSGAPVWDRMKVQERIVAHLVAEGRRRDTEAVLVHQARHGLSFPLAVHRGRGLAQPGFLPMLEHPVPKELLTVDIDTLELSSGLTSVQWVSDGAIGLRGYAFVPGIAEDDVGPPELRLRSADGTFSIELDASKSTDLLLDADSGDPWNSHQDAAFTTNIDVGKIEEQLAGADRPWPDLALEVSRSVAGSRLSGSITRRDRGGSPGVLPLTAAGHAQRYIPGFTEERGLVLRPAPAVRTATTLKLEGRVVDMTVQVPSGEEPVGLVADHQAHRVRCEVAPLTSEAGCVRFSMELPALPAPASDENPAKARSWRIRVRTCDGKYHRLNWPHSSADLAAVSAPAGSLAPVLNARGEVAIRESLFVLVASAARFTAGTNTLDISGRITADDIAGAADSIETLALVSGDQTVKPQFCHIGADGVFTARFPLRQRNWGRTADAPVPGNYALRYYRRDASGHVQVFPIAIDRDLEAELPLSVNAPSAAIQISRSAVSNLYVRFGAPLDADERGAFTQNSLRSRFLASRSRDIVTGAVFFESFSGRAVSDSGLDIFHQLRHRDDERPMYWSIGDHSVTVPEGAEGIVRYSRRWYELLASAEYVVTNGLLPAGFQKGDRQKLIQTWHGTPLKRIGQDGPNDHVNLAQLEALKQQTVAWDYLLAQSSYAAEAISGALGYRGDILTTGAARNDSLVQPDAAVRRQQVRSWLGIAPHQRAVLYAPTWRDDVTDFKRPHGFVNHIDIEAAQRSLPTHYVLMLRSHPDMTGQKPGTSHDFLIDVTSYPDIADLYLATDVLVTDYSAVMFDFCNTSKPMFFLVPDLDKFLNGPRGCYLDFPRIAPGRLVASTQELVAALLDDSADAEMDQRRRQFRAEYAPYDDGKAARRVADAVWGP